MVRFSFISHTASGNGGVLTTTGNAATSVQVSDVTVENSMAVLGGAFELISSAFSCTRCVLTDTQARAESTYLLLTPPHPHHHLGSGDYQRHGVLWRRLYT